MATFRANGQDLEIPDVATLTMDESIVVYGYSGMTLDQLDEIEGLHPGVLAGLVHVAAQRANPEMKAKDIEKAVRATNLLELITSVADDTAEELAEQDLPKEPDSSSPENEQPSGPTSRLSSVPSPDETHPAPTGMPESATSESGPAQAPEELAG